VQNYNIFKDDITRLHHMLDAAQEAVAFAQNYSRIELDTNRMLNISMVHLLEIIGEAARSISSECREIHSEVPWKKMIGMRDRLIHGYFDINLDIVWETVTEDLPPLIVQIESILKLYGK
jgi:uncharacterized protein with HEPN domain